MQYRMDLTSVSSVTPWTNKPKFIEDIDRPQSLVNLLNNGK
jgi:hypothetical protein